MPEGKQQAALGLERKVDGLERDARLGGDGRHRGRRVAALLEEPQPRREDLTSGGGRDRLRSSGVLDRFSDKSGPTVVEEVETVRR
jgi:hypothetical protein